MAAILLLAVGFVKYITAQKKAGWFSPSGATRYGIRGEGSRAAGVSICFLLGCRGGFLGNVHLLGEVVIGGLEAALGQLAERFARLQRQTEHFLAVRVELLGGF